MCSDRVITALVVTLAIISLYACTAQTPCISDGWFGPNCQYQCHCAGSAPCDKNDGSCNSGCHQDWFGPACQYARMSFTRSGGESWLTDSDDTTCNTGNIQSVSVTLDTSIPLTWVRVGISDAVYLDQIQLSYQLSGSSTSLACPGLRKAKVDNQTLDIECSTTEPVSGVTLSGSGVTGLCSLYISGGRNVALKQTAQQSSRLGNLGGPNGFYAENAVDGVLPGDTVERSALFTCTYTVHFTQDPGWWTVTFSQAVDVTWFLIYNRVDCCRDRLAGFTLTAQSVPSTATPYSYTDPGGPGQDNYTVVPSPRISFPVSLVRFVTAHSTNILTLCEVFVFGETNCPAGLFGLRCERQCNCADQGSCFVHSGGCPSGCATGYTGEECSECQPGRYGDRCDQSCSATCGGDNSCDRASGACSHGCDPGYLGTTCETMCGPGTYEAGCSELCSVNCAGPDNACNQVTGVCNVGCDPGFWGNKCLGSCSNECGGLQQTCSRSDGACDICHPGYYGPFCSNLCSNNCGGSDQACDQVTGHCESCPSGFTGAGCDQTALNRDESDDSGVKTWAVVATVVASVAGVVLIIAAFAIGILVRRNNKLSRDGSSTSADRGNNREVETASLGNECRQKPVQQSTVENERPNHYYESTESHPGYVHLYDTDFDHYDRPENLMKESGLYENPLPGNDKDSNQDTKETEQDHAASKNVDDEPYSN